MKISVRNTITDENGQGMAEYALLIGFIALVVVVALALLGPRISSFFMEANDAFATASTGS